MDVRIKHTIENLQRFLRVVLNEILFIFHTWPILNKKAHDLEEHGDEGAAQRREITQFHQDHHVGEEDGQRAQMPLPRRKQAGGARVEVGIEIDDEEQR